MIDNQNIPVITVDGPSGTGKGTICHKIAEHLNWHVLDSGSLYRVLAYIAKKQKINFSNVEQLVQLALSLDVRFEIDPHQQPAIIWNKHNIFDAIRSEECGQDASTIAMMPEVREALLAKQRIFAKLPGLVTDGRDMGTVVFPNAIIKFYLYATPEERARRRYLQLKEKGINVSLAQVVEEMLIRDERDTFRAYSPLKPADDAIMIDTTGLTIVQVLKNVLQLIDNHDFL